MARRRASVQESLPLEDIAGDVVVLRDGGHCAVIEVSGVHFALRSDAEQEAILAGYRRLLNGLSYPVQLLVRVVPADVERYLAGLQETTVRPELRRLLLDHQAFVRRIAGERALLERRFYVVIPAGAEREPRQRQHTPWRRPRRRGPAGGLGDAERRLRFRCNELTQGLAAFGVTARRLGRDDLLTLWRDCLGAPIPRSVRTDGGRHDA